MFEAVRIVGNALHRCLMANIHADGDISRKAQ